MTNVSINASLAMFNVETGIVLDTDESKFVVEEIFLTLSKTNPQALPIKAYKDAKRDCSIGIAGIDKNGHVIPTFNFMSVPSLQCELTGHLSKVGIGVLELSKKHMQALKTARGTVNDLQTLLPYATLVIGSIGSRSTNRDMSFEIHIDYIPTDQIKSILAAANVETINKDKRNRLRSFGYVLTCRKEVEAFIEATGLDTLYLETVEAVEQFQADAKLEDEYDGERVEDYKTKTLRKRVPLAA